MAVENSKTKATKEIAALKKNLAELSKEVMGLTEKKIAEAKQGGKDIMNDLEKRAYEMGKKAKDIMERAEDTVDEGKQYIENTTKAHPLSTIGVTFFIGMLVGTLISKK